jgi:hypothetical protein
MAMQIFGIDFTSRPNKRKPICCLRCRLEDRLLRAEKLEAWIDFEAFEDALRLPGPWIAGIDFPFGQSRAFIENIGWPGTWSAYVAHAQTLSRPQFRNALDGYRVHRSPGDKEHRRRTDIAAGSLSPQKLYGIPVGLMFFEGAPRLLESGVTIPGLHPGDPDRIVVEAYPGILARARIGRRSYKHDSRRGQTRAQFQARRELLREIHRGALQETHGLKVEAPCSLARDPTGDQLDALLCAIQAAWAWRQREEGFGAPPSVDSLEGWIADPALRQP